MGRTRRVSHYNGVSSVESLGIAHRGVLHDNFHGHTHLPNN